jgi:hypothetical protein
MVPRPCRPADRLWWRAGRLRSGTLGFPARCLHSWWASSVRKSGTNARNDAGTNQGLTRAPHPKFLPARQPRTDGCGPAGTWGVSTHVRRRGHCDGEQVHSPVAPGLPVSAHSVQDVVPQLPGQSAAAALRETAEVAQAADDLGYRRFWVGEQHDPPYHRRRSDPHGRHCPKARPTAHRHRLRACLPIPCLLRGTRRAPRCTGVKGTMLRIEPSPPAHRGTPPSTCSRRHGIGRHALMWVLPTSERRAHVTGAGSRRGVSDRAVHRG